MKEKKDGIDTIAGDGGTSNISIESFDVLKHQNSEAYNLLVEALETGFFQEQQGNRSISNLAHDLLQTIEVQGDENEN